VKNGGMTIKFEAESTLHMIRIATSITCLAYASWSDWRTREVSDYVWIVMVLIGAAILFTEWIFKLIPPETYYMVAASIASSFAIGFSLFYLDLFGGADAKAIMSLSILFPLNDKTLLPYLKLMNPILPISTFNNSVLIASLTSIAILVKNIADIIKGCKLFEDIEEESPLKKMLILFSSYRVRAEDLKHKKFIYPIEEISVESGKIKRKIRVRVGVSGGEERLSHLIKLVDSGILRGYVWVTPGLPMMIFMLAGLIISILLGDLIMALMLEVRKLTSP